MKTYNKKASVHINTAKILVTYPILCEGKITGGKSCGGN
jgi:hypothetical protein